MFSNIFPRKRVEVAGNCAVAARMRRTSEQKWKNTRSCLGGTPNLGRKEWPPRMHCVAQIDLSEVAALQLDLQLPEEGGLIFFADTGSFSGSPHLGAVRFVSADQIGIHESDVNSRPLYGADWEYYSPSIGACGFSDAPTSFPHWPLAFHVADQSETSNDEYKPTLDDVFGPKSESVHLPLEGLVTGSERDGRFIPHEDASSFPVRAAQMILNHAVRLTCGLMVSGGGGQTDPAAAYLNQTRKNIAFVEPLLDTLEKWQTIFGELDQDEPLGSEHGPSFTNDLSALATAFQKRGRRFQIGAGTTITGGAGLEAYFAMYCGQRQSFEAIPDEIREYLEKERMRTAYSGSMTHQIGGYGANVQESEMNARGMVLLLQLATDEGAGFMWGDVGVLQFWIDPAELAEGNWEKVEFLMHGH